jgi:hypothetical protein
MFKTWLLWMLKLFIINSQSDQSFRSCFLPPGDWVQNHSASLLPCMEFADVFIFFCVVCICFHISLYSLYHLKCNPTTATSYSPKMKSQAGLVIKCPNLPVAVESRSPLLLGHSSRLLCSGNMIYSQAERVFILHHYFALKSHAAVHEAFSSAQHDKEVWSKTAADQLVNKMFGHRKCFSVNCVHWVTK